MALLSKTEEPGKAPLIATTFPARSEISPTSNPVRTSAVKESMFFEIEAVVSAPLSVVDIDASELGAGPTAVEVKRSARAVASASCNSPFESSSAFGGSNFGASAWGSSAFGGSASVGRAAVAVPRVASAFLRLARHQPAALRLLTAKITLG